VKSKNGAANTNRHACTVVTQSFTILLYFVGENLLFSQTTVQQGLELPIVEDEPVESLFC